MGPICLSCQAEKQMFKDYLALGRVFQNSEELAVSWKGY